MDPNQPRVNRGLPLQRQPPTEAFVQNSRGRPFTFTASQSQPASDFHPQNTLPNPHSQPASQAHPQITFAAPPLKDSTARPSQAAFEISQQLVAPRNILKPRAPKTKAQAAPQPSASFLQSTCPMDKRHPSSFQQLEKVALSAPMSYSLLTPSLAG